MTKANRVFAVAFLTPALALYTAFVFVPIGASMYFSLTNWRIGKPVSFIGLTNYANLFTDHQYWAVASNSLSLVAAAIFVQVPVSLLLAYGLHWVGRGYRFYRSVLFLPVVIAPVAVALAYTVFLNGDVGAFNKMLEAVGLGGLARSWLSDQGTVLWAVNIPNLWQGVGLYTIILVAAIRSLPQELFEAAAVDGASRWLMLPVIVVPNIRDATVICLILAATNAIRTFDQSWVMTQGGPGNASSFFATMMYKVGFIDGRFAYASAISVTLLVYVLLLVFIVRRALPVSED